MYVESIDRALKRLNNWDLTQDDMEYINMAGRGVCEMQDEAGFQNESDTSDRKQENRRRIYKFGSRRVG